MSAARFPQQITYWAATPDGFGGNTFSDPQVIKGRWEDSVEETVDSAGNKIISRAIVYLATDIEVGGYLFLGNSTANDPTLIANTFPARRFDKIPDVRSASYLRKAVL